MAANRSYRALGMPHRGDKEKTKTVSFNRHHLTRRYRCTMIIPPNPNYEENWSWNNSGSSFGLGEFDLLDGQ